MITKKLFQELSDQLPDHEDPAERRLVEEQRCPVCELAQVYVGKKNFSNGKGFAICANPDCDSVEELGIDRNHEHCPKCEKLVLVERAVSIMDKMRINLMCGHSVGWGEH